ncbi:hypothetical protein [Nocardiopsis salina]|uniref:hypothetical protein n=1 Tax=Nocardiopsis salina TaxID=245836 RepID=UPI000346C22F|nr:hypothetical protein [Nocardiopsis salina]
MDTSNHLPVHPATGLRALAVLPSGRIVWPVLGGDGTGDGDTGQPDAPEGEGDGEPEGGEQNDDQGEPGDGEGEPEGAAQLGDPGKKALAAQKQKWRSERDKRRELEKQLAEATKTKGDGDEPTPDQIRADAEQAATAKANRRIVKAELKAAAAGRLADPSDVNAFIDLDQFEVDGDGELDADEISEAITDLLTRKPHLASGEKRRFQGGGDGGAGRDSKPRSLDQQIAEAEAAGDLGRSLRLKQAKLAEARKNTK